MKSEESNICEYCETKVNLTKHHLVPRAVARRMLKANRPKVIKMILCRKCHDRVHYLASENILSKIYNTPERIVKLLKENKIVKEECIPNNHKEYALF